MSNSSVRVRFAPSPTGIMHIGNIRTALLNYIYARKQNGTFVVRIEDTDPQRNFDPGAKKIQEDLAWLALSFDEGPKAGGPYEPYYQSKRNELYQEQLQKLQEKKFIYQCFCSEEELEKKRNRAIALKLPPRYDRTCAKLTPEQIKKNISDAIPFIWRFKIDTTQKITFEDIARGTMTFDLEHFADFPITRKDGSATFIFANAVDDMLMNMTHVLRGEDHLSNTTNQIVLLKAMGGTIPKYWHLPIICSTSGKKLSKRDFGFSLHDLRNSGFLPEAIVNYLGIIGSSFNKEILSLNELVQEFDLAHTKSSGSIMYDVEKLRWVNDQWISRYSTEQLLPYVLPFLQEAYPDIENLSEKQVVKLIALVQPELATTHEIVDKLQFYFVRPVATNEQFTNHIDQADLKKISTIIKQHVETVTNPNEFLTAIKQEAKLQEIKMKNLFTFLRLALTGQTHGQTMNDLLITLGPDESKQRIQTALECLV